MTTAWLKSAMHRLLWAPVRLEANRQVRKWLRAVRRGPEVQDRLVRDCLALAAGSDFARDHGLDRVRSAEDLRKAVPVAGYERAEPYIDRVAQGDIQALFAPDTRIHMFALTSGTTGRPKQIPVTDALLAAYRRSWHVWAVYAYYTHWDTFGAKILQVASPMDEHVTPSGIPAGSMSGLTETVQRRSVRWLYAIPPGTGYAENIDDRLYLACRFGLMHRSVMPLTANPSTLLNLARAMNRHKEDLLRDLADGTLRKGLAIDAQRRRQFEGHLKPSPHRVRALEAVVNTAGHLHPRDAWQLPLIGTWKGGTLGLYLREMPPYWGSGPVRDIGLIASEGRLSIPIQSDGSAGVLDTTGTVFEFMPEAEAGKDDPETVLPHQVEVEGRYFLVLTTPSALFRYDIGDLVEVTHRYGPVPVIRFLNKGEHVSSLTGEKLTEFQVTSAVNRAIREVGTPVASYCLCPTWDVIPYYTLLVETADVDADSGPALAAEVDRRLGHLNIEYEGKRSSCRLGPVRVKTIREGRWAEYDSRAVARRGGRIEQYKHKFLVNEVDFEQQFDVLQTYGPHAGAEAGPCA